MTINRDLVTLAPDCDISVEQIAALPLSLHAVQAMESICNELPKGSKVSHAFTLALPPTLLRTVRDQLEIPIDDVDGRFSFSVPTKELVVLRCNWPSTSELRETSGSSRKRLPIRGRRCKTSWSDWAPPTSLWRLRCRS